MNLKCLPLKSFCMNGLCRLAVAAAPRATPSTVPLPVRSLGVVFRRGISRSSSSSSLALRQNSLGYPWHSKHPIQCSTGTDSVDFHGILGQFVRSSTTQASPAADISEGEKPKASTNKAQVSFDELRSLIQDNKVTLVDVREPEELQEKGCLPNCINIPLTKLKAALALSDEEFKQTYDKPKLQKDDINVIFYGLSSVKSSAAVEIAHKMGYKKSRHFPGGMEEWTQKHQKT